MSVAAAIPIPAFHQTNGSDLINPKCFKFLKKNKKLMKIGKIGRKTKKKTKVSIR